MKINTFTKIDFMPIKKPFYRLFFFFFLMIFNVTAQEAKDSIKIKNSHLVQPSYLKKGDTIAIVAPSGILANRQLAIDKATKLVKSWGLNVVYGKNIYNNGNHFAGTDEDRAEDMQWALDTKSIKAIWAARGGYGTARILDLLDFTAFKKQPKWIVGYSDITALHNHVNILGIETMHAMMPTSTEEDDNETTETIATFKKALFGEKLRYTIPSNSLNREGKVTGELVGGNLTLLVTMLGSKSSISTDGKILFFEEIGEYKYHIDRMLQSLKRAGYFDNCKGIIVGGMTKLRKNTTSWGESIEELILNVVPKNIPVLFDFPAGHDADNQAIILGRTIQLDVKKGSSTVIFKK